MNPASDPLPDFHQAMASGIDALTGGRRADALAWALAAIRSEPRSEEAWLLLAAIASPDKRLPYLDHVLSLNPKSAAALEAKAELAHLAKKNVRATDGVKLPSVKEILKSTSTKNARPTPIPQTVQTDGFPGESQAIPSAPRRQGIRWSIVIVSISCLLGLFATAFGTVMTEAQEPPVMARLEKNYGTPQPTFTPSYTPSITPSFTPTYTNTYTPTPTYTETPTDTPTNTEVPTVYIPPPPPGSGGEHWIDVDISSQTLTAYAGDTPIRTFLVSTGVAQHPTVVGRFHIYMRLLYALMVGPGYYLPNVPYTQYFYKGYSIHGTYWHHNFGTPMSHGCVNMYTPDAAWVWDFTTVGTLVYTHW